MKKLLIISLLIASLAATSANAGTKAEGSYLGFDILKANTEVRASNISKANTDNSFNTETKDSRIGFGINYKYVINMNDFFIAPGIFHESIGAETKVYNAVGKYTQNVKISSRQGAKFDFGYNIMDKFATYIPLGLASTNYSLSTKDITP